MASKPIHDLFSSEMTEILNFREVHVHVHRWMPFPTTIMSSLTNENWLFYGPLRLHLPNDHCVYQYWRMSCQCADMAALLAFVVVFDKKKELDYNFGRVQLIKI